MGEKKNSVVLDYSLTVFVFFFFLSWLLSFYDRLPAADVKSIKINEEKKKEKENEEHINTVSKWRNKTPDQ